MRHGHDGRSRTTPPGTRADALWNAVGSNKEFDAVGRSRLNADKRRAVEMALRCRPDLSGREVAKHVGVGNQLVESVRKTICVIHTDSRAVTRTVNGRPQVYTMQTSAIGRRGQIIPVDNLALPAGFASGRGRLVRTGLTMPRAGASVGTMGLQPMPAQSHEPTIAVTEPRRERSLKVRARGGFLAWLARLAAHERLPVAMLVERAIVERAERVGFEPPPRR